MTKDTLRAVKAAMEEMNLEYAFRRFRGRPGYPYFVGDYMEADPVSEDGQQECTFTLTGFARGAGSEDSLETAKEAVRDYFTQEGRAFPFADGIVVISYGNAQNIPTEDAELDRIQINLSIKEWSVR